MRFHTGLTLKLLLILFLSNSASAKTWRGIVPLKSTRVRNSEDCIRSGNSDLKDSRKSSFDSSNLCNRLSKLKRLPIKDESGVDPVFDAFMAAGDDVIPCLIQRITDTHPMHDPRCPAWAETVAVGDTAYYVFIYKTNLEFAQFLPKSVQEEYKTQGDMAFNEWIRKKGARRKLRLTLQDWYRKNHT